MIQRKNKRRFGNGRTSYQRCLTFLFSVILILAIVAANVAVNADIANADVIDLKVNHDSQSNALKIQVGNNTYTYDTNTSFSSSILHDVGGQACNPLNFQVVNYSTFESVASTLFDKEWKDVQDWLTVTVLPAQHSIDQNFTAYTQCVGDRDYWRGQYKFQNETVNELLAKEVDEKDNTILYLIIGLILLFVLMILMIGHNVGAFDRFKERRMGGNPPSS